jgi:hypothetical protein
MSALERAIEIAVNAHAGQIDNAGEPHDLIYPLFSLTLKRRGGL